MINKNYYQLYKNILKNKIYRKNTNRCDIKYFFKNPKKDMASYPGKSFKPLWPYPIHILCKHD